MAPVVGLFDGIVQIAQAVGRLDAGLGLALLVDALVAQQKIKIVDVAFEVGQLELHGRVEAAGVVQVQVLKVADQNEARHVFWVFEFGDVALGLFVGFGQVFAL